MTDISQGKKYRLAIRRPVAIAMFFLTIIVFGWKSYQQLPINLMPNISYPTLTVRTEYEGAAPEDVEKLIADLHARSVWTAEMIPIRNKPEVLVHYVTAMRRAGLVVVGGTEHNTLDLLPIEPTCLAGAPVPQEIKDIFWEGACVMAAHQFLALHGECGFVDSAGRKNPAYRNDEDRIAAFRALGAAVIEKYYRVLGKTAS